MKTKTSKPLSTFRGKTVSIISATDQLYKEIMNGKNNMDAWSNSEDLVRFKLRVRILLNNIKCFIDSAFGKEGEKEKYYDEIEAYANKIIKEKYDEEN